MMTALADLALKATALLMLAAAVTGLMRRASAASRHLVWTGMFGALLLLPVARFALPPIRVAVFTPPVPPQILGTVQVTAPDVASANVAGTETQARVSTEPARRSSVAPNTLVFVVACWSAGAGAIGLRLILGIISTRRLGRRAHVLTNMSVLSYLERVRRRLGIQRSIRVLESPDQRMPVTWGIVRPVILLPSQVLAWNAESSGQLDAVLAHEAAHIARWDALSELVARLAMALCWFNPLIWIAARVARLEREQACDDVVLAMGQKPSEYAGHLLAVARSLAAPAVVCADGLAMARHAQIEHRIRAILDERLDRRGPSRASLAVTSALVAVMLPVSAVCLSADPRPAVAAIPSTAHVPTPAAPLRGTPVRTPASTAARTVRPTGAPPQTTSSPPPPAQSSAESAADANWRAERVAMMQQVLDRATRQLNEMRAKVEIGTLAPIDTAQGQRTVEEIQRALLAERERAFPGGAPSDAGRASVSQRFAIALRNLFDAEVRFTAGLATVVELDAAVVAAADVVRRPASASTAPGADGSMTDAALIAALKATATIVSDVDRANTLLSLAQRNALSPEMVALYVGAASGIASDTERARVFAQPIRVKPPGR